MTMTAPADEDPITIAELAARFRISTDKAYSLAKSREIPAFKIGRIWRVYLSEAKAALEAPTDPWQRPARSRARRSA